VEGGLEPAKKYGDPEKFRAFLFKDRPALFVGTLYAYFDHHESVI
jgi:hypothetical protein